MILKTLHDYAVEEQLSDAMEVKEKLVHLVLSLRNDGTVSDVAPWQRLTREVENPKTKSIKIELGRWLLMPEIPVVSSGGKAHFLADAFVKVLGVNGTTGEPISDDPKQGGNATKAFQHFWQRIADAHAATGHPDLSALLAFRERYLASEESRRSLAFVGMVPFGKDQKPTFCALINDQPEPLDKVTITFSVGASGAALFKVGSPLHDYWRGVFRRERFTDGLEAEHNDSKRSSTRRGVCLVTGDENATIAEVHRTLIKGVPGLPPIGGYLVSFDRSSPALTSYGFEGGWNAPVSEAVTVSYAMALNHILADDLCRRRFGGSVLASWIDSAPTLTGEINKFILEPPVSKTDFKAFFHKFESGGEYFSTLNTQRFRSVTLAANGGRVVVRRWLDEPLRDAVAALRLWFQHLEIVAIEVPRKKTALGDKEKPSNAPPPLSIYALAATTARVPSEVPDGVYDALYRAALEPGFNPRSLLAPVLQRIRIAASQFGNGVRFKTSHFALLKLLLMRSQSPEDPMEITPQLCETHDAAYNCGRLLALLDDIQEQAQGQVGADVVARFYGNASTFPRNVFQRLMRLEKHHRAKLLKSNDRKKQAAGRALGRKIDEVCALFAPKTLGGSPDFPGLLSAQEQGRFALGFHQQKARNVADRDDHLAKNAGSEATGETLD